MSQPRGDGFVFYAEPVRVGRYHVGVGERDTEWGPAPAIVAVSPNCSAELTEEEARELLQLLPGLIEAVTS